jgi:hypothetical protein
MTDNFEKAMQDIAIRGARNGGPDIQDVLIALQAVNEDGEERHEQTMESIGDLNKRMGAVESMQTKHWEWTEAVQTPRIVACESAIAVLQREPSEHALMHAAHMREHHERAPRRNDDEPDADFTDNRTEPEVKRYTKEQIVVAIIIAIVLVATNAAVTWLIVRALEMTTLG